VLLFKCCSCDMREIKSCAMNCRKMEGKTMCE
jgi:hypothetical protein